MISLKRFSLFFFFGLLLGLPFFLFPMNNPDIFWHLSSGKYIFENLSIAKSDFLSWTLSGLKWIDFEWLTQVIYYFLYSQFNIEAIYFLKIVLISLSAFVFSLIVVKKEVDERHLLWLLPLLCASISTSSDARPENFSVLLFLILWLKTQDLSETVPPLKTFGLFFVFFSLWTNLHAGFIYGIILLLLRFAGAFLEENLCFLAGKETFSFKLSKNVLFIIISAIAGTFLNPYGFEIYTVIIKHLVYLSSYTQFIMEWRDFDITVPYFRPFSFILLVFPFAYLWNFLKNRKVDFFELFMSVFFIFSALFHIRNLVFASFVMLIVSANFIKNLKKLSHFILLSFSIIFSLALHFFSYPAKDYINFRIANFYFSSPKLIKFLKENETELSKLKMYNLWAWGGYLGFNLYPSYKVFMDGRYIFSHMLSEFVPAKESLQLLRQAIKKYDFSLVITSPSSTRITVRKKLKDGSDYAVNMPLYLLQFPKEDWAIVYFDRKNVVAVKRSSVSPSWLKKKEYKLLAPNALDNIDYPVYHAEIAIKEVEREVVKYFIENPPDNENSMAIELLNWYKHLRIKGKKND